MSKNKKIVTGLILIVLIVFGIYKVSVHKFVGGAFYNQNSTGGPSGHMTMAQGTTTPCAIQSPNATTTYVSFTANFTTSTTTSYVAVLAKSTDAFSTTTVLARLASGANSLMTLNATNTLPVLTDNIVAPNTWFVMSMQGGVGNFSPVGSCNLTLGSVN